ncbi:MAG: tetratricopeptide repeat protein [Myxococcota bacterium]|nr:tetratricopeptide repeat protein [Myxococcota bacterium]
MTRRGTGRAAAACAALLAAFPAPSRADLAAREAEVRGLAVDVAALAREAGVRIDEDRSRQVEERLADGEMFFRLRFWEEAGILFLDIVENHPRHTAYSDALFSLAESLYQADDPYGAREYFERVLGHAGEMRFRPYLHRALGRLIEIAIRTEDFDDVERYFAELNRLPTGEVAAVAPYFRGKYHYFRGNLQDAERAFVSVPDDSRYVLHARYFIGAILTKHGRYPQALDAFQRVLLTPASTDEDKQVVDLTYLAVGRLSYELNKYDEAVAAYQRLSQDSKYFDRALYEVAWVHLARLDTTRARRALELLIIYNEDSRYAPEAKVLLGNILLREGRMVSNEECFLLDAEQRIAAAEGGRASAREAEGNGPGGVRAAVAPGCAGAGRAGGTGHAVDAFEGVRAAYGPVYDEVRRAVGSRQDMREYFRDQIRSGAADLAPPALLPPLARAWFDQERGVDRAHGAVEGLAAIRRYLADVERFASQLEGILAGRTAVGAFGDLRGVRDRALLVANRCAAVRADLAIERDRATGEAAGDLGRVRQERRAVDAALRQLPTTEQAISGAYDVQRAGVGDISHALTQTVHTIELIESMASALDMYLVHPANWGSLTEGEVEAIRSEVRLIRGAVGHYRGTAADMRRRVDVLRAQVHVGEVTAESARELRDRHRELTAREGALIRAAGREGGNLDRIDAALVALDRVETDLAAVERTLGDQAEGRGGRLLATVRQERANAERYRAALAAAEAAAEEVVGNLAYQNFRTITGRFQDLLLRSDVGVVDTAWSLSEEHRRRMILMGQQRDRELAAIRVEYDELLGQ